MMFEIKNKDGGIYNFELFGPILFQSKNVETIK